MTQGAGEYIKGLQAKLAEKDNQILILEHIVRELELKVADHHPTDIITECHWCGWTHG